MTGQAYLLALLGGAVFAAAYQTQTGWLYVVAAGAFAAFAVMIAAAWRSVRGVDLTALAVPPAWQGGAATLAFALTRRKPGVSPAVQLLWPAKRPGRMFGFWRGALVPDRWQAVSLAAVTTDAPGRATFSVPAPARGEFPLPEMVLQCAYPLGLVAMTRRLRFEGRYLVFPVGEPLDGLPWLAPASDASGRQKLTDDRQGTLIRGVREFRSGDAWREVHWRTTARRGVPHVRENERDRGDALVLYLDLRAAVHTEATLEHMVAVAASIVAHCDEIGRPVRLATQPEAEPQGPAPQGYEAWAWLARAQATATSLPDGPEGAVLLSSDYVGAWRAWASHFVYTPGAAANAMDATVYCPVGAPLAAALATDRAAW